MSLPSQSEVDKSYNSKRIPQNPPSQYPNFPPSQPGQNPGIYEKPNPNYRPPPQNMNPPPQNMNPPPAAPAPGNRPPVPVAQPVYVAPPVGMVAPGVVPVMAPPVYPYGVYPQPYPYPYPVANPTVVVVPPGYHRDFTGGYSPWGNLADDLDNLF